jgi:hypothetical protein
LLYNKLLLTRLDDVQRGYAHYRHREGRKRHEIGTGPRRRS